MTHAELLAIVPWSLVVFLFAQTGGLVWWMSRVGTLVQELNSKIDELKTEHARQLTRVESYIADATTQNRDRIQRLENQLFRSPT